MLRTLRTFFRTRCPSRQAAIVAAWEEIADASPRLTAAELYARVTARCGCTSSEVTAALLGDQ